jgi:hypothetical protein
MTLKNLLPRGRDRAVEASRPVKTVIAMNSSARWKRLLAGGAICAALATALIPAPAQAWWGYGWGWHAGWGWRGWGWRGWGWGPGVVIGVPPVVVGAPAYAPPARWVPPHYAWNGAYVPGHWAY